MLGEILISSLEKTAVYIVATSHRFGSNIDSWSVAWLHLDELFKKIVITDSSLIPRPSMHWSSVWSFAV